MAIRFQSSPAMARKAGQLASLALLLALVAQLLLVVGILPASWAWGGRQTVLTPVLRVSSLAAAVVLALGTYTIRLRAGLVRGRRPGRTVRGLSWLITIALFLNTVANFASPSVAERLLFGPLALVAALACLVVSLSPPAD